MSVKVVAQPGMAGRKPSAPVPERIFVAGVTLKCGKLTLPARLRDSYQRHTGARRPRASERSSLIGETSKAAS